MSPHQARALLEALLDETAWPWRRRLSLLLDVLLLSEERNEDTS
jgi:hypothetical protein